MRGLLVHRDLQSVVPRLACTHVVVSHERVRQGKACRQLGNAGRISDAAGGWNRSTRNGRSCSLIAVYVHVQPVTTRTDIVGRNRRIRGQSLLHAEVPLI